MQAWSQWGTPTAGYTTQGYQPPPPPATPSTGATPAAAAPAAPAAPMPGAAPYPLAYHQYYSAAPPLPGSTPDFSQQWSALQQQQWQQWQQWQHQFQQWQAQYGDKYQESMNAMMGVAGSAAPAPNVPPPALGPEQLGQPPPLPPPDKGTPGSINTSAPPPPPDERPLEPNPYGGMGKPPAGPESGYASGYSLGPYSMPPPHRPPLPSQPPPMQAQPASTANKMLSRDDMTKPPPPPPPKRPSDPEPSGQGGPVDPSKKVRTDGYSSQGAGGDGFSVGPNEERSAGGNTNSSNSSGQQQWQGAKSKTESHSSRKPKENLDEMLEAEKTFDIQFKHWEEQFAKWKEQNINHPDKAQYREYEAKWEAWKENLLQRRTQMRRKREAACRQQQQQQQDQSPQQEGQTPGSTERRDSPFNKGLSSTTGGGAGFFSSDSSRPTEDQNKPFPSPQPDKAQQQDENPAAEGFNFNDASGTGNFANQPAGSEEKGKPGFQDTPHAFLGKTEEPSGQEGFIGSGSRESSGGIPGLDLLGDGKTEGNQGIVEEEKAQEEDRQLSIGHDKDERKDSSARSFSGSAKGSEGPDTQSTGSGAEDTAEKTAAETEQSPNKPLFGTAGPGPGSGPVGNQAGASLLGPGGPPRPSSGAGGSQGPGQMGGPPLFGAPPNIRGPAPGPFQGQGFMGPPPGYGGQMQGPPPGYGPGGQQGPRNFQHAPPPFGHPPGGNQNFRPGGMGNFGPNSQNFNSGAPDGQGPGGFPPNNRGPGNFNNQGPGNNQNSPGFGGSQGLLGAMPGNHQLFGPDKAMQPFGGGNNQSGPPFNSQGGNEARGPPAGQGFAGGGPMNSQPFNNSGPNSLGSLNTQTFGGGPPPGNQNFGNKPPPLFGNNQNMGRGGAGPPAGPSSGTSGPNAPGAHSGPGAPGGPSGAGGPGGFGQGHALLPNPPQPAVFDGNRGWKESPEKGGWNREPPPGRESFLGGRDNRGDFQGGRGDFPRDFRERDGPGPGLLEIPDVPHDPGFAGPSPRDRFGNDNLPDMDRGHNEHEMGGPGPGPGLGGDRGRGRGRGRGSWGGGRGRFRDDGCGPEPGPGGPPEAPWERSVKDDLFGRPGRWSEENPPPAPQPGLPLPRRFPDPPPPKMWGGGGRGDDRFGRGGGGSGWDQGRDWDRLEPATVVDYGHRPAAPDAINPVNTFPEPVQTFDYGHGSSTRRPDVPGPGPNTAIPPPGRPADNWRRDEPPPSFRGGRDRDDRLHRDREWGRGTWDHDRDFRKRDPGQWERERDRDRGRLDMDMAHEHSRDRDRERDRDRDDKGRWGDDGDRGWPGSGDRWGRDHRQDRDLDRDRDRGSGRDWGNRSERTESFPPPPDAPPPPSFAPTPSEPTSVLVEDLLSPPGRASRPARLVIILRGPPGSGKTFVAKLIKDKEIEMGGSAPRILCLDDYFMVEMEKEDKDPETGRKFTTKVMEYEYEAGMDKHYRSSLVKAFRKTVLDGYFPFIIVDCINDKVKHFEEMWSFAKQKGFQVYICEMDMDASSCTKRNIHNRSEKDILDIIKNWEDTPKHHLRLDVRSLLQSVAITEVEMEDTTEEENKEGSAAEAADGDKSDGNTQAGDAAPEGEEDVDSNAFISKWERMDPTGDKLDRLDGLAKRRRTEQAPRTLEDWLQLTDEYDRRRSKPGERRVRWADLEERRQQEKMRAIGFVVGQTDWSRMTDPTFGEGALTQTKYI